MVLSFQHALQRLSAITEYQLADYLILQKANFSAPLVWACFDDFTPQQQALQHYSLHQGWEVYAYDLGKNQTNCFCFAAKDEAEELEQLSSWLKNRLTLGDQHIGVIVPDLEKSNLFKAFPPSARTRRRNQHLFRRTFRTVSLSVSRFNLA